MSYARLIMPVSFSDNSAAGEVLVTYPAGTLVEFGRLDVNFGHHCLVVADPAYTREYLARQFFRPLTPLEELAAVM